jgi:predicted transcriptional regulator of viral defense system
VAEVEERDVLERNRIEVAVELAIDDVQDVTVELCGDPLRVVVGRLEHLGVLDEIGAEQQPVAWAEEGRDPRKQRPPGLGVKFPIVDPRLK